MHVLHDIVINNSPTRAISNLFLKYLNGNFSTHTS